MNGPPTIGLLGIMQELYDEMIPGITEHQAQFAAAVAEQLSDCAAVTFTRPARNQSDIEQISAELAAAGVDGVMIVMLTYGPAMRTIRALTGLPVPLALANIQPERAVTADWNMDTPDLQPGDPWRAGSGQRARARGRAVLSHHRRLALGALRARVRGLGARGPGDHRAAALEAGAARLPDERDGRHPLRPGGDAAQDRRDRDQRGPRRAARPGRRRP